MLNAQRFPFLEKYDEFGVPNSTPYLPLTLTYQNRSLDVLGLLDTGASINVLPYEIGREFRNNLGTANTFNSFSR